MIAKLNYIVNSGEILKWMGLFVFSFNVYTIVKIAIQIVIQ